MEIDYDASLPISNTELNQLYDSAWPSHKTMDFTSELEHSLFYITARIEGTLIGFVKVIWDGGQHGFVLETTVEPKYQHKGIGTQLLEHLKIEAKERGLVWLHVDFEPHLLKFYRAAGFFYTEAGLVNLGEIKD